MLPRFRRISTLFACLAGIALVAACVTAQTRHEHRQLDDNAIHAAVMARLSGSHFSNLDSIDVNVTNGVVTLAGEVPNESARADAEAAANSVRGVRRVNNNLQVSNPQRR